MWFVLLTFGTAFAGADPGSDLTTPQGRQAEYVRLSEELIKVTKKNNWVAVERLYTKLDAMGLPHTHPVLFNAALAARNRGDVTAAKKRLLEAQKVQETKEVTDMLWTMQKSFGPVMLAADLPANYRLEAKSMPFDPLLRKAVEYGQEEILENSFFEGLLPRGEYVFKPYGETDSPRSFAFTLRADRQRFDLRTHDEPTNRDRKKRARIDKKVAKLEAKAAGK